MLCTCFWFRHNSVISMDAPVQEQFIEGGGVLWDNCPVTQLIPGNHTVKVSTSKGYLSAKRVVLTVGPWAPKWMKSLKINTEIKVSLSL